MPDPAADSSPDAAQFPPGALLQIALTDGRFGGAWVLGWSTGVVHLAILGSIHDCQPGELDLAASPVAIDHVAVPAARIAAMRVVGDRALNEEALAGGYRAWHAPGAAQPVVDLPLGALIAALAAETVG